MKTLNYNRKTHQQTGFTLIELLIVLAIIGLLAALVGPSVFHVDRFSPREATLSQIANLEAALDTYRLDIHEYPKTLEALIKNETICLFHHPSQDFSANLSPITYYQYKGQ